MKSFKVTLIAAVLFLCGIQLSIGQGILAPGDNVTDAGQQQGSQALKARLTALVSESYRTYKSSIDDHWKLGTIDRLAREKEIDALNQWAKKTRQQIREGDDNELIVLSQSILGANTDSGPMPAASFNSSR